MQSDNLDKKIKEAADHHHPAYDENAWNKMEKLLDTHLPQKKDDKRRIIFFILLFLLLGSGAWFLVAKPWQSAKPTAINSEKNNSIISFQTPANNNLSAQEITGVTTTNSNEKIHNINEQKTNTRLVSSGITPNQYTEALREVINDKLKRTIRTNTSYQKNETLDNSQQTLVNKDRNSVVGNELSPVKTDQEDNNKQNDVNVSNTKDISPNNTSSVKTEESQKVIDKNESNISVDNKKDQTLTPATSSVSKKNSGKSKKNNFLSFSLSAGPDISKVGSSNAGRATLTYGAGVNYTLNRFTLHSGFFVAKKIYDANGNDYKLDHQLPPNVKLTNVAANCNVFEIPLNLTYNFGKNKNSNWYAGLGLSTYLMKKEKYTYDYTYSSGQTYTRNNSVSNVNKHYFSIANVMAGYTRQISNTVSISAEPYLKIPLTGIGLGKVHLNSGGVLFTVGVKAFQKKKGSK